MAVMNAIVNANKVAKDAPDIAGAATAVVKNQPPVAEGSTAVVATSQEQVQECGEPTPQKPKRQREQQTNSNIVVHTQEGKVAGYSGKRREPYKVMVEIIVRCTSSRQEMRLLTRYILISSRRKEICCMTHFVMSLVRNQTYVGRTGTRPMRSHPDFPTGGRVFSQTQTQSVHARVRPFVADFSQFLQSQNNSFLP
jgi:hypothetical protein